MKSADTKSQLERDMVLAVRAYALALGSGQTAVAPHLKLLAELGAKHLALDPKR